MACRNHLRTHSVSAVRTLTTVFIGVFARPSIGSVPKRAHNLLSCILIRLSVDDIPCYVHRTFSDLHHRLRDQHHLHKRRRRRRCTQVRMILMPVKRRLLKISSIAKRVHRELRPVPLRQPLPPLTLPLRIPTRQDGSLPTKKAICLTSRTRRPFTGHLPCYFTELFSVGSNAKFQMRLISSPAVCGRCGSRRCSPSDQSCGIVLRSERTVRDTDMIPRVL